MGIFDLFKRLLGDRSVADANMLQDIRRKNNADLARKKREKEFDQLFRLRKIQLQRSLGSRVKAEPSAVKLTGISLQDILGFEPKRRKKK